MSPASGGPDSPQMNWNHIPDLLRDNGEYKQKLKDTNYTVVESHVHSTVQHDILSSNCYDYTTPSNIFGIKEVILLTAIYRFL